MAFEIQKRYENPTRRRPTSAPASRSKEVVIGFGHPVYTVAIPQQVIKGWRALR